MLSEPVIVEAPNAELLPLLSICTELVLFVTTIPDGVGKVIADKSIAPPPLIFIAVAALLIVRFDNVALANSMIFMAV